jgi:xanthine dehydrogenase large subunit
LSPAGFGADLFHCTNAYFVPNVTRRLSCRTNLPPNTAFRGFGGPQGMFVIESAIAQAAENLNVSPVEIPAQKSTARRAMFFPYGQIAASEAETELAASR